MDERARIVVFILEGDAETSRHCWLKSGARSLHYFTYIKTLKPIYVVRKNLSTHCKFHII